MTQVAETWFSVLAWCRKKAVEVAWRESGDGLDPAGWPKSRHLAAARYMRVPERAMMHDGRHRGACCVSGSAAAREELFNLEAEMRRMAYATALNVKMPAESSSHRSRNGSWVWPVASV